MLDCQLRSWWFKSPSGQTTGLRFLTNCAPCKLSYSYNEYTDCTLSGEVQRVRKRIGHLLSYANAKKMKLLTLHSNGCLSCRIVTIIKSLVSTIYVYFLLLYIYYLHHSIFCSSC